MFINKKHEDAYNLFVKKSNIDSDDIEKSLILFIGYDGRYKETYWRILYDFKNNWIKLEGLNKDCKLVEVLQLHTRLGFNLANGYRGKEDSICESNRC